jgi:acyl-CoA reductase-like NAD-dependent aldehyde dehydrogenase
VPTNRIEQASLMRFLDSRNPLTREVLGSVPVTPVSEVPDVVARARAALPGWRALGVEQRMRVLLPVAELITSRVERYGALITGEMGKPLADACREVRGCGERLPRELADMVDALLPETVEDANVTSSVRHDPYGVCATITPWNFPFLMPHWLVIPALMAGNAVVLKPSEETPLVGQAYADTVNEVLPEGVLQTMHGDDEQGKALVSAEVDLIAFTGSVAAGKHILGAASRDLKRVILELGGKGPFVVLPGADLDAAATLAARSAFSNAGQVCVSAERLLVHEAVADELLRKLAEEAKFWTVGDGVADGTRVGPMVNSRQRTHVLDQVTGALAAGAELVYGGEVPDDRFLPPTILSGVTPEMDISREETFGPVLAVTVVGNDDEAVALANDTPYGLSAIVFGGAERAAAVADRLVAGMIGVNADCRGAYGTPWVGARQSGYGYHGSPDGHRQFAQTRVVTTPKAGGR